MRFFRMFAVYYRHRRDLGDSVFTAAYLALHDAASFY